MTEASNPQAAPRVQPEPKFTELPPGYLGVRMQQIVGVSALHGLPFVWIGPVFLPVPKEKA